MLPVCPVDIIINPFVGVRGEALRTLQLWLFFYDLSTSPYVDPIPYLESESSSHLRPADAMDFYNSPS
jgi:hypothetical protein